MHAFTDVRLAGVLLRRVALTSVSCRPIISG